MSQAKPLSAGNDDRPAYSEEAQLDVVVVVDADAAVAAVVELEGRDAELRRCAAAVGDEDKRCGTELAEVGEVVGRPVRQIPFPERR